MDPIAQKIAEILAKSKGENNDSQQEETQMPEVERLNTESLKVKSDTGR